MSLTVPSKALALGSKASFLEQAQELEEGKLSAKHNDSEPSNLATPSSKPSESELPLPNKQGIRAYRYLRWNFGSVYRRIFSLVFVGNIVAFFVLLAHSFSGANTFTYQTASIAVSANLLASLLVRNEHVVNAMFVVLGTWPKVLPLWCRRLFAKVYSYGGIHSGGATAATLWYIVFLVLLTEDSIRESFPSLLRSLTLISSFGVLLLLIVILAFAHPAMRVKYHDTFEATHRFMGWSAILLFWAQTMLSTADQADVGNVSFAQGLLRSASFWMLIVITLLVIYPWARLRLRDVEAEVLSDHCVKLNFHHRNVHYGQAIRLTDSPLRETHAFAVIPYPPAPSSESPIQAEEISGQDQQTKVSSFSHVGEKGFSVLVSNAGDWTNKIIHNPPTKIYTRGTPQYGVLRVAGLFEPCIVMATGSGIGPCLSLFVEKPNHPVRIIWSTPNPEETYGQAVIDQLYKADPRAIIIDTKKTGRPDLVKIAYNVWESSKKEARPSSQDGLEGKVVKGSGPCEAVVIISNMKVTKKVVYGLESRGIPAYGAIFDS
ncbi:Adenylate-forming reductase [Paramyrothecium foliicola]|nr:Adenylate-forming reductase [Paramyrothecium foliicola]